MGVQSGFIRRDINGQIREKLAELGISAEFAYTPEQGGRMMWLVGGVPMTTGEAADRYLPGGFAGNFGRLAGLGSADVPSTTVLAALIAVSPRFRDDAARYFDDIAAKYGADTAGVAWTQACLKADQDGI